MGEFNFNDILNEDEISSLFEDSSDVQDTPPEEKENNDNEDTAEVDVDDIFSDDEENDTESPESVGSEENKQDTEGASSQKKGTSPNNAFYSSIAKALKEDGTLPDLDDEMLNNIASAEDFASAIDAQVLAKLDEKQKRINAALEVGVTPTEIQQYEKTLDYLGTLTEESIKDESEAGENLRKQLIYQDFINRGYSKERAVREVTKSFNAGSDLDDAMEALQSNKDFFKGNYDKIISDAKKAEDARKANEKKEAEVLKKSILEDKNVFGDLVVDNIQRKKIFDTISKPTYKDPDTGEYLTEIQKYEKENHNDFMKYVGLVYTLTDGFKNLDGLIKGKVNKEMKKGLRNLENTINNSSRNSDGSLNFVTSRHSDDDPSYFGKGGWVPDI